MFQHAVPASQSPVCASKSFLEVCRYESTSTFPVCATNIAFITEHITHSHCIVSLATLVTLGRNKATSTPSMSQKQSRSCTCSARRYCVHAHSSLMTSTIQMDTSHEFDSARQDCWTDRQSKRHTYTRAYAQSVKKRGIVSESHNMQEQSSFSSTRLVKGMHELVKGIHELVKGIQENKREKGNHINCTSSQPRETRHSNSAHSSKASHMLRAMLHMESVVA